MKFALTVLWAFTVLEVSAQVRSKAPQATYSYQNPNLAHTVKVVFINPTTIGFTMALRNRKTGQVCTLRGQAHTEPGGSTEAGTDERGNGYLALTFNYSQGPVFVSFQFQLVRQHPLWRSPRLQIGSETSGLPKGCDFTSTDSYTSTDYILARVP